MIVDLHIHTVFSEDSLIAPEDLIEQALKIGLDGVCVMEHNSFQGGDILKDFAVGTSLKIFQGVEATTDLGDMLIYGINQKEWQVFQSKGLIKAQELIDYVRNCGGVCIPAHPFRFQSSSVSEKLETLIGIFAIEGYNGKADIEENRLAWEKAETLNLKLVGGSDAHVLGQVGKCITEFLKPVDTMSDLVKHLKNGDFQARYLF